MRDKELTSSSSCGQAEELVAYLYNEASEAETKDFERHLRTCAPCEAELAAFGHVRSSIAVWRSQALGNVEANALATAAIAPTLERSREAARRRPSALAALREFFALSPIWLRAATVLTSLAVCALVVWAAARLMEAPSVLNVEKVVEKGPTQAEVEALVAKRVREELAAQSNPGETHSKESVAAVSVQRDLTLPQSVPTVSRAASAPRRARSARRSPAQQVSTQEYEELARDLQLVPTRDEEDLPRLIDLIDEAN